LRQIIRSDDARSPFGAMAARAAAGSIRPVMAILGRSRAQALVDASVDHVYGAALAASADRGAAEDVTQAVMVEAATGRARADARSLVERAVLRAVRVAPHPAFDAMGAGEREAVALARLAGYSVPEIADALGIAPPEVRSRLTSGARTLAGVS
jgi:DNA-directed RNA polymerase specialized sigma24 family protein